MLSPPPRLALGLLRSIDRPNAFSYCSCRTRLYSMRVVREHDIVLLKHRNNPSAPIVTGKLRPGRKTQISSTKWKDSVEHDNIIGRELREVVVSKKGVAYRVLEPTLAEYTDSTPRLVTPIYSQDASLIVSLLDLHPPSPRPHVANEDRLEIFEAGTGHGALTLHLARAIHAGNTPSPDIPAATPILEDGNNPDKDALDAFDLWKISRRAVIHTLDNNIAHSQHARQVVRNFRKGIYFPHIDFHTGTIEDYLSTRLEETTDKPFLDHTILDLPLTHDYFEIVSKAIKPNGTLLAFCPSITQINACALRSKQLNLPLFLEKVLEIGGGIGTGGREWDVRFVKPRSQLKYEMNEAQAVPENTMEGVVVDVGLPEATGGGEDMVCRPKVGLRVAGGGFVGVWRRIASFSEPTMV